MGWFKQWKRLCARYITEAQGLPGLGAAGLNAAGATHSQIFKIRLAYADACERLARSVRARMVTGMTVSAIAHVILLFAPWAETTPVTIQPETTVEVALVDEIIPPDPIPAAGDLPELDDAPVDQGSSLATDSLVLYEPTNVKAVACDALVGFCGRRGLEPLRPGRLRVHVPSGASIGAHGLGNGCLFSLDQLDMLPRLRHGAKPYYPRMLLDSRVEGTVRLLVLLDTKGRVRVLRILKSDDPGFTDSAVRAAEQFVYDPPTRHGKPVNTEFTLPIDFSIE